MKKLLFLFLLIPIISQAQWVQLNSNTTEHLNAVAFTSVDTGYVVGWNGTILKTIDGGDNWIDLSLNNDWDLADVCFPAKDTGYIYGTRVNNTYGSVVKILKTIDGGNNWTLQDSILNGDSACSGFFGGIDFLNANTGIIVPGSSFFFLTRNGGETWRHISLYEICGPTQNQLDYGQLYDVNIYDSTHAVAVGMGDAYHSFNFTDTSIIWNCLSQGQLGMTNNLYSVCFADTNTVFAVGPPGRIHKVTNNNWNGKETYYIDTLSSFLGTVLFPTPDTGYIIPGIYKTIDFGNNWNFTSAVSIGASDIFFINSYIGYLVGSNGVIFKTTNGGVSNFEEFSLKDDIEIYPNPFTDEVRIKTLNKKDYAYKIISTEGRVLKTGKIKHEIEKINLQAIDSKILLIKILDNNKEIICTRKLVKED